MTKREILEEIKIIKFTHFDKETGQLISVNDKVRKISKLQTQLKEMENK